MIATILPSGQNFFAVEYNERKVQKGVARLFEIQNFPLAVTQQPTSTALRNYLIAYSSKNDRIKNTQFHVAISCKGHEHTETELVDFVHKWLAEMGYADKGQPLLIYAHTDTENTHIHIVTSRVNPLGKKIDHNHERRRSQAAIDKILGHDKKKEVGNMIEAALQYRFSSINQFRAVLESGGAEVYVKSDTIFVKKGGSIQGKVSVADVTGKLYQGEPDKARIKQLQAIVRRYQASSGDTKELQDTLKKKFGISLVFFGKADSPYGYMVVDNSTKQVFNGSQVMKIKDLLDFMTPKERFKRIDMAIQSELLSGPFVTTAEINRMLRRQFHTQIKKGEISYAGKTVKLNKGIVNKLRRNDRIHWAMTFSPSDADECEVIAGIAKLPTGSFLTPTAPNPQILPTLALITAVMNSGSNGTPPPNWRSILKGRDISVVEHNGSYFAVDFEKKVIVNLTAYGINIPQKQVSPALTHPPTPTSKHHRSSGHPISGHGQKREWEIRQGLGDRVDDERSLKM